VEEQGNTLKDHVISSGVHDILHKEPAVHSYYAKTIHTRHGSLLGPPGRLILGVLDEERSCLEEFTDA